VYSPERLQFWHWRRPRMFTDRPRRSRLRRRKRPRPSISRATGDRFRKRTGGRRHDCTGRLEGEQLQHERAAKHLIAIISVVVEGLRPLGPVLLGLLEGFERVVHAHGLTVVPWVP
jgi:hypothetical protein